MYLKIGNTVICNSDTDGITKMLSAPTPTLTKASDSVQPFGSRNPTHFQRKGVSREIEITVLREFESYRAAEVWVVEHMAEMESLYEHGDLDFESFLGVGYLYGSAALSDIEVVDATGVSVEIKYKFKAGRAIIYFGVSITDENDGEEYIASLDDCYPLVRVAKG